MVQVHTLPPTAEAASQHILRTYQQGRSWVGDERKIYLILDDRCQTDLT